VMLNKRLRYIGWVTLLLALLLLLALSGLAQSQTDTPEAAVTATDTIEVTATPEPEATSALEATTEAAAEETEPATEEDATPTPEVTLEAEAEAELTPTVTVAITETVSVAPAVVTDTIPLAEETLGPPRSVVAEQRSSLQLTVYNQNLGLVKEVRTLALDAGANRVRYTDVASGIEPTSVHFVSLTDPEGTLVLEQNYEYDLVSTAKLLEKYLDGEIALRTREGSIYTGTLLSGVDDVILSTEDGVRVVRLDQIQEFSFPQLPEGLITKPSLVWLLDAAEAGEQDVRVTYLTSGVNWRADYIAMLAPDNASLALTGWVTVDNRSGASYQEARLKLVAGDVHRVTTPEMMTFDAAQEQRLVLAGPPQVEERAFFEYHIYEVQRLVTVGNNQTKQIEFAAAPIISATRVLLYEASPAGQPGRVIADANYGLGAAVKVQARLEFANSEESGLGVPLPRGIVRVYQEDADGGAEFVGEDTIDHAPRNELLSLYLGDAFDVVGERTQVAFRKIGDTAAEESIKIALRNHKDEDIVVRVIEHLFRAPDAEITTIDAEYEMVDATTLRCDMAIEADGEASLQYTVRYTW
jgi:hypothetical protein